MTSAFGGKADVSGSAKCTLVIGATKFGLRQRIPGLQETGCGADTAARIRLTKGLHDPNDNDREDDEEAMQRKNRGRRAQSQRMGTAHHMPNHSASVRRRSCLPMP